MTATTLDRLNGINSGIAIKAPCRAATTTNITLSGAQTIDGVAVVADDRVLVKNQTNGVENGIYDVSSGSWTRSLDFDGNRDIVTGTLIAVNSGTAGASTIWSVTTTGTITIGTTSITIAAYNTTLSGVSAFMLTVLDDTTAAAARATLVAATTGANTFTGTQTMSGVSLKTAKDTLASATTTSLSSALGNFIHITGTTTITSFGASVAGETYILKFNAALTLTHNATSLILPGGANITTVAGDMAVVTADDSSGNWRVISYTRATLVPGTNLTPITGSLGANVALNNTGSYFAGPFVAQGSTGTWFVSGTVTLQTVTSGSVFAVKLWDGTTVIASAQVVGSAANTNYTVSLSGYLATPASNLIISVKDGINTDSLIVYNASGNSKDSTITAIRVA